VNEPFVDATAVVERNVSVGRGTRIWHGAHVREGAAIGEECVVGKDVYIDVGVRIGNRCKIQNQALLYRECTVGNGVFIGPGAIVANDRYPRAVNPDGSLKEVIDWLHGRTTIQDGASIGTRAVVFPGVTIGDWSLVGALSLVTKDVPPHGLVVGIPGRLLGSVCFCGSRCEGNQVCEVCGWSEFC